MPRSFRSSAVRLGRPHHQCRFGVTFRCKDYRAAGRACTLATDEFVRRFLIHILPHGFHRVRHYGLFANGNRAANIARAREVKHAMKAEARKIA